MRFSVVAMLGAISLCIGCAGAGETESTTEDVGTDAAPWFWTGPPPTGIVATPDSSSETEGVVVAVQAAREQAAQLTRARQ